MNEIADKSQTVRLIDIIFLGPYMIYAGTKLPTTAMKTIMIVSGILTITYNFNNYRRNL